MSGPRASGKPPSRRLLPLALAVACLAVAVGCESSKHVAAPIDPEPPTPEEQLEHVIERLKYALDTAQASSASGVMSDRTCKYQLLDRTEENPRRRAEVTITTRRGLTVLPAAPKEKPKPKKSALGDGALDVPPSVAAELPEPTVDEAKFVLEYGDDRWQLTTKPESNTLAVCWEFALRE